MVISGGPDKGWSWVVMIGSFGIHFIYGFFMNGLGVLQVALLEEYKDAVWKTAWAAGLFVGVLHLLGPVSGFIVNMWSCRFALIIGAILTTIGLLVSGFVRDINYVIFLIGIVSGFGACLSIHASEIVIGYNFVRYRNLACGIAVSGTGIGTLLFTPLMQMAKDYYGYTGLCLMCSALSLHLLIFAALCRPSFIEIKSKKEGKGHVKKAVSDFLRSFRLLRHGHFAFLCSSMTASSFGTFLMNVHFTSLILEQGTSKTSAANFLSISGACNACARFLVGMTSNSDNINELILYSGCFGILGISALAIPTYIEYYGGQIAFAMFLGTYSGCCYTLLNTINVKLLGIENLSMAYGIELLAGGIGATSGPVVSGFLVDSGLSYAQAFMIAGFSVLLGGLFGGSVACFDKGRASNDSGVEHPQIAQTNNGGNGIKNKEEHHKNLPLKHVTAGNDTSSYI